MNIKRQILAVAMTSLLFVSNAQAADAPAPSAAGANKEAIAKVLQKYRLHVQEINAVGLPGMFEVITDGGIVYANQDGSYFIYGQLFQNTNDQTVNLTERSQAGRNQAALAAANVEKEMIVYPAKNEKFIVNVFTDVSCGYCVKLHSEMQQYNDLGITVRYLAYPRGGERSPVFEQMSAIWCAKNPAEAFDKARKNEFTDKNKNCADMLKRHIALGDQVGVNGTPAILLQDGSMLSGYLPPAQLLEVLQQKAKAAPAN